MAAKSAEQQGSSEPGTHLAEIFAGSGDLRALIILTPHCLDQFRRGKRISREEAEQELFKLMIAEGTFMSAAPGWLRSPVFTSVGYIVGSETIARFASNRLWTKASVSWRRQAFEEQINKSGPEPIQRSNARVLAH